MYRSSKLTEIENRLSSHPEFGDLVAIEQRNLSRLRVGLALLASRSLSSSRLLRVSEASDADLVVILRDPVLRNAFETDIKATVEGVVGSRSLLQRLLSSPTHLTQAADALGGRQTHSAWPQHGSTWVWTESLRQDSCPREARLWQLRDAAFTNHEAQVPIEADSEQLRLLNQAAELLATILPTMGPGVLRQIGMIGLATDETREGPMHSMSGGDPFPAAVFLDPAELENPWVGAAALLHEGLHLALFEIIRCGALTLDHVNVESPVISIPWRTQKWSLNRALFALHVYVHLALFDELAQGAALDVRSRYGEPPSSIALDAAAGSTGDFGTSAQRAVYLASELYGLLPLLTDYGHQFVIWLAEMLDRLAAREQNGLDPTTYHAAEPLAAIALPDQKRLVVATAKPAQLLWLNANAWLIFALCDGRELAAIQMEYVAIVRNALSRAEAERQLRIGLQDLVARGLVLSRPTP